MYDISTLKKADIVIVDRAKMTALVELNGFNDFPFSFYLNKYRHDARQFEHDTVKLVNEAVSRMIATQVFAIHPFAKLIDMNFCLYLCKYLFPRVIEPSTKLLRPIRIAILFVF